MGDVLSYNIHVDVGVLVLFIVFASRGVFFFLEHGSVGSDEGGFGFLSIIIDGILVGGVVEGVDNDGILDTLIALVVPNESVSDLCPVVEISLWPLLLF